MILNLDKRDLVVLSIFPALIVLHNVSEGLMMLYFIVWVVWLFVGKRPTSLNQAQKEIRATYDETKPEEFDETQDWEGATPLNHRKSSENQHEKSFTKQDKMRVLAGMDLRGKHPKAIHTLSVSGKIGDDDALEI